MNPADALQAWLALEHEAIWLYGVIGGRFDDLFADARSAWNDHRDCRDRLATIISRAGSRPAGPAIGYQPARIGTTTAARAAAQDIESRITAACVRALDDPRERRFALATLRASAERAAAWGAAPQAFPGLA